MVSYDIHDLLERCIEDGFSVDSISKATDIPAELINRCRNNEKLTMEDIHTLTYLLVFLMQLYAVDPNDDAYLQMLVEVMNRYFEIPTNTIAKYLNLEESAFNIFLAQPKSFPDGYAISNKLIHLFTQLIRDKRHSS
jgi:hypothetical protein